MFTKFDDIRELALIHLPVDIFEAFETVADLYSVVSDTESEMAFYELKTALENPDTTPENLNRVLSFLASNAERILLGYPNPWESKEVTEQKHNAIRILSSKTASFNKISGASNNEGRITQITALLDTHFQASAIDILEEKIHEGLPFQLVLFYSSSRELSDFIETLESRSIVHPEKYLRFVHVPVLSSNIIPWVRDT